MLNFFRRKPLRKYTVLGRRYTVPPNKQPVFWLFSIEAPSLYEASRKFDITYPNWTRIDTTEVL